MPFSIMEIYPYMWLIHSVSKNLVLNKMRLLFKIYHGLATLTAIRPNTEMWTTAQQTLTLYKEIHEREYWQIKINPSLQLKMGLIPCILWMWINGVVEKVKDNTLRNIHDLFNMIQDTKSIPVNENCFLNPANLHQYCTYIYTSLHM